MSHDQPSGEPSAPLSSTAGRRRAAGIYGAIITASVMTAAGDTLDTLPLALSVLITLAVYWLAEQYAEVLGEQTSQGRLPSWRRIMHGLAVSWPIVSASFVPLAALVVTRLAGASAFAAASAGVGTALALLTLHGWTAARAARLTGWRLAAATSIAAALGVVMVTLKHVVLLRLH
jgi:hypothetical protein